jgi:hypothetical protein
MGGTQRGSRNHALPVESLTVDATMVVLGCPHTTVKFQPKLFKNRNVEQQIRISGKIQNQQFSMSSQNQDSTLPCCAVSEEIGICIDIEKN